MGKMGVDFLYKRWLLIFCCLFLGVELVNAQEADFGGSGYHSVIELWPSVKLSKDFKHGFNVNAQYVLRIDGDFKGTQGNYFYLQTKYKINSYLHADAQFRYVTSNIQDLYRFEIGLKPRYTYKDFTFAYRVAYFREYEYFSSRYESGHEPTNFIRNALSIDWDFKKHWNAQLSGETWNQFGINKPFILKRIAVIAAVSHEFGKLHELKLSYLNQPDFSKKSLTDVNAFIITYTFNIPSAKMIKKLKKQHEKRKYYKNAVPVEVQP